MARAVVLALLTVFTLSAQDRVPKEFAYHHVWAVVPFIGTGKPDDPKRPMFVPSPAERKQTATAKQRPAILSYSMQVSDDGTKALVEFVGVNHAALKFIVESKDPNVKAFEQGVATKEDIETEFPKHKHNFTLDSFAGRTQ
jgi:hypothetical protein